MNEAEAVAWKKATRTRLHAMRDDLGLDTRERLSAAISDKLVGLDEFEPARTIAAYVSFGSEFDTTAFVTAVLGSGKHLLLPKVDRTRRTLGFYAVTDMPSSLLPGPWGILEPDPLRCPLADLNEVDLMLVPGLAFTKRCERLGYGGGYYDGAMGMVRPTAFKVAAAFATQIVNTLVVEPHDKNVDAVVTENASYFAGAPIN